MHAATSALVVQKITHNPEGFYSGIFSRPKKDGSNRLILNLKKLNSYIKYQHFKMESIQNVIEILKPNVFMASVDLKDAFYSIPIASEHHRYLKFKFRNESYKFIAMPNGYGPAMRIFTKITKVLFTKLKEFQYESVLYVDDYFLQGNTSEN